MISVSGCLGRETTWSGEVAVTGDVIVPDGAKLIILPGTTVRGAEKLADSALPVNRLAFGERRSLTRHDLIYLLVYGELEIRGEPGREVNLSGERWGGVLLLGNARARLTHARLRSWSTGLAALDFSRLYAADCFFEGDECGAAFGCFSTALLRRGRFVSPETGLRLHDDASVKASDCLVENSGLAASRDAAASLLWIRGRERGNKDSGPLQQAPAPKRKRFTLRDIQRWVLASGRFPPLRVIYAAAYKLAASAIRLAWKLRFPAILEIAVHRGLSQPDWTPGSSDIDLRLIIKPLAPAAERRFVRDFWNHYRAVKRFLPILGEVQIIDEREARFVGKWGGARERSLGQNEDWIRSWLWLGEASSACLYLLQQSYFLLEPERYPDYGFKISKGWLDTERHCAVALDGGGAPLSRSETLAACGPERALLSRPLDIGRRQALELSVLALRRLDQACSAFVETAKRLGLDAEAPPAAAWTDDVPEAERSFWRERGKELEAEGLAKLHGFQYDGHYRWLIVADVDDGPALEKLFERVRALRLAEPALSNPPSILSPAVFQFLLWSPYLDSPFLHRGLSPDSSDGLAIRAGGRSPLLAWSRRAQWKLPAGGFLSPSKTLLELSLGQSLANLVLSLRLFGLEGWAGDNSYRIVLLYSRLLSARLYQEKGLLCDPGDLDGLLTAHRSAFPESHAELAGPLESALALRPEDLNAISQTSCFRRHYPAYRRLLDSLLEGREGAALLL